jgi:hypothetical protein
MARRRKASGLNAGIAASAGKPPVYHSSPGGLPPGIRNGIARLAEARLGVYASGPNEGEQYLYLAGIIESPEELVHAEKVFKEGKVETLKPRVRQVRGLITNQTLPLCEQTWPSGDVTTEDVNIDTALNHIKIIVGADCLVDVKCVADLEAFLEAIVAPDAEPFYFHFNTGAKTPTAERSVENVREYWNGSRGLEDYEPEEAESMSDATGGKQDEVPLEEGEEEEGEGEKPIDYLALGRAADAGDEEAEETLMELAEAAGITKLSTFDDMSWEEVGERLSSGDTSESEEESWEVGQVCKYKAPKKRVATFEILEIDEGNGTCTLQNFATEEVHEDVLIGNLMPPE